MYVALMAVGATISVASGVFYSERRISWFLQKVPDVGVYDTVAGSAVLPSVRPRIKIDLVSKHDE